MKFTKELIIGVVLLAVALIGIVVPPAYMYSKHSINVVSKLALMSNYLKLLNLSRWGSIEVIHSEEHVIKELIKIRVLVSGGALIINDSSVSNLLKIKVLKPRGNVPFITSTPKYTVRFGGNVLKAEVRGGALVVSVPKGMLKTLYIKVDGGATKVEATQPNITNLIIYINGGASNILIKELSNTSASITASGGLLSLKLYLSSLVDKALTKVSTTISGGLASIKVRSLGYKLKLMSKISGGLAELSINGKKLYAFGPKESTYVDEGYSEAPKKLIILADVNGGLATIKVMRGENH